jgi:hypothetical protein
MRSKELKAKNLLISSGSFLIDFGRSGVVGNSFVIVEFGVADLESLYGI